MNVRGKAFVFGDRIDTDVLAPGPYMRESLAVLASHCLEAVDPDFAGQVRPGDIVVGGESFGIGSSREQAVQALAKLGVGAIIAKSFARIFYRNAINIGLPIVECPEASEKISAGDKIAVDFDTGVITNLTKNESYQGEPFPAFIQGIISAGGLMNAIKAGKL